MQHNVIGSDIRTQVRALAENYRSIHACLDLDRVARQHAQVPKLATLPDDFGAVADGGRGDSYIIAQRSTRTRAKGITQLVDIITGHSRASSDIVLDLLGGDGLVERVLSSVGRDTLLIVTCDASPFMVQTAWERGIPAVLQRAESSVFRTGSVGGVLLAYGTHHIPVPLRQTVVDEAFRVIQLGGVFVLHDFLAGSPVDTWFTKVVDVYAATGHDYAHFDRDLTKSYLDSAGFVDVEVRLMDDPFVVRGRTEDEAELGLGRYLVDMYGLVGLIEESGPEGAYKLAFELACEIFQYERPGGERHEVRGKYDDPTRSWSMTMPREALVVFGRKPA